MEHGWVLASAEWGSLAHCVLGLRWKRVRFRALDRDSVPASPGVYALCGRPPLQIRDSLIRGLYDVFYIGRSDNLRERFLQHLTYPKEEIRRITECFGPPDDLSYWLVTVSAEQSRPLEALLIRCFRPPANRIRGIQARLGPPVPA